MEVKIFHMWAGSTMGLWHTSIPIPIGIISYKLASGKLGASW